MFLFLKKLWRRNKRKLQIQMQRIETNHHFLLRVNLMFVTNNLKKYHIFYNGSRYLCLQFYLMKKEEIISSIKRQEKNWKYKEYILIDFIVTLSDVIMSEVRIFCLELFWMILISFHENTPIWQLSAVFVSLSELFDNFKTFRFVLFWKMPFFRQIFILYVI